MNCLACFGIAFLILQCAFERSCSTYDIGDSSLQFFRPAFADRFVFAVALQGSATLSFQAKNGSLLELDTAPIKLRANSITFPSVSGIVVHENATTGTKLAADASIIILHKWRGYALPSDYTIFNMYQQLYQPSAIVVFGGTEITSLRRSLFGVPEFPFSASLVHLFSKHATCPASESYTQDGYFELGAMQSVWFSEDTSNLTMPIVQITWQSYYTIVANLDNATLAGLNVTLTDVGYNAWYSLRHGWWFPAWMTVQFAWGMLNVILCIVLLAGSDCVKSLRVICLSIELACNLRTC
jgi:hypothetical protein